MCSSRRNQSGVPICTREVPPVCRHTCICSREMALKCRHRVGVVKYKLLHSTFSFSFRFVLFFFPLFVCCIVFEPNLKFGKYSDISQC